MEVVHCDCKRLMGFFRNRAVGHRPGLKPPHDCLCAFHFLQRNSFLRVFKIHQATQIAVLFLIRFLCILLEKTIIPCPCRLLQKMDCLWVIAVFFPPAPSLVLSHAVQSQVRLKPQRVKRPGMAVFHLFRNIFQSDSAHSADRAGKVLVRHLF